MKQESKTITIYTTFDGKEFTDKRQAEDHEKKISEVVYFSVSAYPDLTEGRNGPKHIGCIAVVAKNRHEMFAEHACFELFGSKIAFCMGVFGSNAIIQNWRIGNSGSKPDGKIIATVQDRFAASKIYEDGVNDLRGE